MKGRAPARVGVGLPQYLRPRLLQILTVVATKVQTSPTLGRKGPCEALTASVGTTVQIAQEGAWGQGLGALSGGRPQEVNSASVHSGSCFYFLDLCVLISSLSFLGIY